MCFVLMAFYFLVISPDVYHKHFYVFVFLLAYATIIELQNCLLFLPAGLYSIQTKKMKFELMKRNLKAFGLSALIVVATLSAVIFSFFGLNLPFFPLTLFLSITSCLNVYCYSLFKPTLPSFVNDLLVRVVFILLILLRYFQFISLNQLVFSFAATYFLQTAILFIYILKIDNPKLIPNNNIFKKETLYPVLAYGLILAFASLSSLSLRYIDGIILAKYLPLSQLAIYSVAAFIPTIIEAPISVIEKMVNPKISELLHNNNFDALKKVYYRNTSNLLIIGCFIFLMVTCNLDVLFYFIPDYIQGKNIAIIISFSALFNMITGVNNAIIFNSDNYKKGTLLLTTLLTIALAINIILIPKYGLMGAALATAIASFLYNLSKYFFILVKYKLQPISKEMFGLTIVTVMSFLFFEFVFESSFSNVFFVAILKSVIIILSYILLIFSFKLLELKNILNFIKKYH
jgi:O-antigen/teichoic acid export membrane protein